MAVRYKNKAVRDRLGDHMVHIEFDERTAKIFETLTGDHMPGGRKNQQGMVDRRLAIVFDDEFICAPVIRDQIRDGKAVIMGLRDASEADMIANCLMSGALWAPVKVGNVLIKERVH